MGQGGEVGGHQTSRVIFPGHVAPNAGPTAPPFGRRRNVPMSSLLRRNPTKIIPFILVHPTKIIPFILVSAFCCISLLCGRPYT
jgi:hypothetical protein